MSLINQYIYTLATSVFAILGLAFFVAFQPIRKNLKRTFVLYSASIILWGTGQAYALYEPNIILSLISVKICHIGVIFIPIFFVHFLLNLLEKAKDYKKLIFILYGIGFFLLFFIPSRAIVKDVTLNPPHFRYVYNPGYLYPLLITFWFSSVCYGFYMLFTEFIRSSGIRRNQLKYLFVGTLFGYLGGISNFLFAYDIHIKIYMPFGTYAIPLYVAIFAYAITKYRLMDIKIAVTRAAVFLFVYAAVLGIPFIAGYRLLGRGLWYIPLLLGIVLASAGPFIYGIIRRRAENRLRREEFLAHQALNRLAQNMMRFTNLGTLLKLIVHHIIKIMKVDSASIYLKEEESGYYRLRATWTINNTSPEQSEFTQDSPLIKDILLRKISIVLDELEFGETSKISPHVKRLQSELHKAKAAVVVPGFKGNRLVGFLMLGARRSGRLFTQEDLNLLLLLANQSVLAIENAELFEREKTFLAEKSRRGALADMAPGVSHQFNNRLMAIIAAAEAQMALLDEEEAKKLDSEKLKRLIAESRDALDSIMKEALKGKDIAKAILKKGKAKITYAKADIGPVIQSAIDLLKVSKTRSSLGGAREPDILLDIEKGLPQLILSESLMQDIFYNLIDNARDAVIMKAVFINENKIKAEDTPHKGKITITARAQDGNVVVTVSDDGLGIKKEDKKKLFIPYFTTKATANKGTGMGLWTIRGFIESHKGAIAVESEYRKGTTFTLTFPINAEIG